MLWCLLDPASLNPTEDVDLDRVDSLECKIVSEQTWSQPIAIHEGELFVMDGHHRLTVARRLKLGRIPAVLLDYDCVRVEAWREGETITPHDIVAMARSGRRFPIKTTRHVFDPPLPVCNVPLCELYRLCPSHKAAGSASATTSAGPKI